MFFVTVFADDLLLVAPILYLVNELFLKTLRCVLRNILITV